MTKRSSRFCAPVLRTYYPIYNRLGGQSQPGGHDEAACRRNGTPLRQAVQRKLLMKVRSSAWSMR